MPDCRRSSHRASLRRGGANQPWDGEHEVPVGHRGADLVGDGATGFGGEAEHLRSLVVENLPVHRGAGLAETVADETVFGFWPRPLAQQPDLGRGH